MSRSKLYHLPGYVWHITQRCHNKDFLLRFNRDRTRWLQWMFYAKRKYRLIILAYCVTSNHIHLVVYDDGRKHIIPRSMMLAASRVALEYNKRKKRSGSYWEDNYHATAVETGSHLQQCLVYVELNMVRAKVVSHPKEWPFCSYQEITNNRRRNRLLDKPILMSLLGINRPEELKENYEQWIEKNVSPDKLQRQSKWTESIAVGNREFVEQIKGTLGIKAEYRDVEETEGGFVLKEEVYGFKG